MKDVEVVREVVDLCAREWNDLEEGIASTESHSFAFRFKGKRYVAVGNAEYRWLGAYQVNAGGELVESSSPLPDTFMDALYAAYFRHVRATLPDIIQAAWAVEKEREEKGEPAGCAVDQVMRWLLANPVLFEGYARPLLRNAIAEEHNRAITGFYARSLEWDLDRLEREFSGLADEDDESI